MGLLTSLRAILPACSATITEGARDAPPQDTLRGPSVETVRAAVTALPNDARFATRESYRDVLYAIKAALPDEPDEAFGLALEWSAKWTEGANDPDIVEADWRRMKGPFRRGWNWLAALAEEMGPAPADGGFTRAALWFEEPSNVVPLFPLQAETAVAEAIEARALRYAFITLDEAADGAVTGVSTYLVKGLLDRGAMSVLYGASNTGKTFVAFLLAYCIASGRPFGGMRVRKGRTVIIAAEGGSGARKRAAALVRKLGGCSDFLLLLSGVDLYNAAADLEPLIVAILALGGVEFVVLDTLARVMAGGDENATKDMSAFVKNIDRLRHATGAHVMLVHHSGKDAAKGARGSSALRAATDTEIEIADNLISVQKQRDMDKSWTCGFRFDAVELGRDEDDDPITSGVVTLLLPEAEGEAKVPATKAEREVLKALADVGATLEQPAKRQDLFEVMKGAAGSKTRQDVVRHHLASLLSKGLVCQPKRGLWALGSVANTSNATEKWQNEFG